MNRCSISGHYIEPCGICQTIRRAMWLLNDRSDSFGTDARSTRSERCRVPARRHPRPDWVRSRQIALGRRIGDLRRAADLSQDQLADRMGVERRTIQRYENAVTDPRYADLLLLARALRVHVTDLL